jgi:hypothetical protein
MNDPIKVIFKYKNNNRKIQYQTYIFIGDLINKKTERVLHKIKDTDFYDSLMNLDVKEVNLLVDEYGEFWYDKIFVSHHINYAIDNLLKNKAKADQLIKKFGKSWFDKHIRDYKLVARKVFYNYESVVRDEKLRKMTRKQSKNYKYDQDEMLDYTTGRKEFGAVQHTIRPLSRSTKYDNWCDETPDSSENNSVYEAKYMNSNDESEYLSKLFNEDPHDQKYIDDFVGGAVDSFLDIEDNARGYADIDNEDVAKMVDTDEIGQGEEEEKKEEKITTEDEFDENVELDIANLDILYQDLDVKKDENIVNTTNLIKKAINDDRYESNTNVLEFDTGKDNEVYDGNIRDCIKKHFIKNQYIFKDDTIKTIKNKICCSIRNNNKFGKDSYIIPSYQYIWSEYYYGNKFEKVMIGSKWMRKNELLNIDIEPNSNLHVYENVRGNLKFLKDNIKRYGSKIKREDDENNILYDYDDFITNNEIFMIDIYNELGLTYEVNQEELKNLIDVYIKIYFPKIKPDDVKNIIDFLKDVKKGKNSNEVNKLKSIYDTINNDLILENEIMREVEQVNKENKDYKNIFKQTYITQSVIRTYLNFNTPFAGDDTNPYNKKLDLFRIFDSFIVNEEYSFIQHQTTDGQITFKFDPIHLTEKKEILSKWFENSPYGISFKVKIRDPSNKKNTSGSSPKEDKFMAINLSETGRIDYKIQWKEDDMSTIDDIKNTYNYIKKLIEKINNENVNNSIKINIPNDEEFKFAFINTIQKIEIPGKYTINHNDLSEFSRYFYPYVALVIEPRKRQSKIKKDTADEKSKFGTYLRYKRISKYENRTKIEHRIVYFMRHYDYNDQSLATEISKLFNITEERAIEEIENVREKYPNIKKSRKVLKKLENIPKYKPPGIEVDIQGKQRENYKMRIAGARDKQQLERIINFMNILIYLYAETYLLKKQDRQFFKEKIKKLTNIAKRRNKVEEIVNYDHEVKSIKQMTAIDKKRIGFKPEKGQSQWTRYCQNSGNDKRRRPQIFNSSNLDQMIKKGYAYNKESGFYERTVQVPVGNKKNGKKKSVVLRAVKLGTGDENDIYYTCNPEDNDIHMYIGFLSRSVNPYGEPMPCCFIKDPMISKNKEKRDFFLKCIGRLEDKDKDQAVDGKILGDKLYILQDTNKIQEGRFGFLPKYLDVFLNFMMGKDRKIRNHYLISTKTGYFFKYGIKQENFAFLNAIANLFNTSVPNIINNIKKVLTASSGKGLSVYTSLNNGDIKTQFGNVDEYLRYIEYNEFMDYKYLNDVLSIPGVIDKNGINIVYFKKKIKIIKKVLEKEKIKEDYVIVCHNPENVCNLIDKNRKTVLILKEGRYYYPIIMVRKDDDLSKDIILTKYFTYTASDKNNIISHVNNYYKINCTSLKEIKSEYIIDNSVAKVTYDFLQEMNNKDYLPKSQIVDARNKCKYIITNNNTIIPVKPSGSVYNLQINANINDFLLSYDTTLKQLDELNKISNGKLNTNVIGIYYNSKTDTNVTVTAFMTRTRGYVPIKPQTVDMKIIEKNKFIIENKPLFDEIDNEIAKGKENYLIDERIKAVNNNNYQTEAYQLFRLHISNYLNSAEGADVKELIEKILQNVKTEAESHNKKKIQKTISKREVRILLRKILYQITNTNLFNMYLRTLQDKATINLEQEGGSKNENFELKKKVQQLPITIVDNNDIDKLTNKYNVNNIRQVCLIHTEKNQCNVNPHCKWNSSKKECQMILSDEMIIDFINKVSEELSQNELKAAEILRKSNYYVSDIVDYNRYTERDNQKIIKNTNNNIKKILSEIFGKDNIPKIGKRRYGKSTHALQSYDEKNLEHPIKDMGEWYIQNIIDNNNSIYRAFANGYHWLYNEYNDIAYKNLGYFSDLQSDLANFFKSVVVDWLLLEENTDVIEKELIDHIPQKKITNISKFAIKLSNDLATLSNGVIELYVLSRILSVRINVYNENNILIYIFDNKKGIMYDYFKNKSRDNIQQFDNMDKKSIKDCINIKFNYITHNPHPDTIEIIYVK